MVALLIALAIVIVLGGVGAAVVFVQHDNSASSSGGASSSASTQPSPIRTTDPSTAFRQGQLSGRGSVTQSNPSFFCDAQARSRFRNDPSAYNAFLQGCFNPY